ncbi:hypothetical protein SAMN05660816_05773 [Niastella yeongjuensis]|nr:hypothetical protein SAMN05660816_05773 [Niastella yeongjuensis]
MVMKAWRLINLILAIIVLILFVAITGYNFEKNILLSITSASIAINLTVNIAKRRSN